MFAVLRIAALIGLIFYFSPVRRGVEQPDRLAEAARDAMPQGSAAGSIDALWRTLPATAKQALLDRVLASGLGQPARPRTDAQPTSARDTLEPEDLQPAWRGEDPVAPAREAPRWLVQSRRPAPEAPARLQRSFAERPRP
jgi:hypothetical protein